ncbi:MAG: hypothetical protein AVDCRST_MAG59-4579, partial [uncultured Thermomicrobiales bacterium]
CGIPVIGWPPSVPPTHRAMLNGVRALRPPWPGRIGRSRSRNRIHCLRSHD